MKRKLLLPFIVAAFAMFAIAATVLDKPAITTPTSDDIFYVIDNPLVSPVDRKITAANLRSFMTNGVVIAAGNNLLTGENVVSNAEAFKIVRPIVDHNIWRPGALQILLKTNYTGAFEGLEAPLMVQAGDAVGYWVSDGEGGHGSGQQYVNTDGLGNLTNGWSMIALQPHTAGGALVFAPLGTNTSYVVAEQEKQIKFTTENSSTAIGVLVYGDYPNYQLYDKNNATAANQLGQWVYFDGLLQWRVSSPTYSGIRTVHELNENGSIRHSGLDSRIVLNQTTSSTDNKRWQLDTRSDGFQITLDSDGGTNQNPVMIWIRDGTNLVSWTSKAESNIFEGPVYVPGGLIGTPGGTNTLIGTSQQTNTLTDAISDTSGANTVAQTNLAAVINASRGWVSVTPDGTNIVCDLAGASDSAPRSFYVNGLATSGHIIFSNYVAGAHGAVWINCLGTEQLISADADLEKPHDVTWALSVTNRAWISYAVGFVAAATNTTVAIARFD